MLECHYQILRVERPVSVSIHDVLPSDILGALVTKNTLGQTFYSVAGFSLCNNLATLGHDSALKCHI